MKILIKAKDLKRKVTFEKFYDITLIDINEVDMDIIFEFTKLEAERLGLIKECEEDV